LFFNKELSLEVIKEYYCSNIKLSKKEQYSDTFKLKVLFLKPNPEKNNPDGKYLTTFWTTKQEEKDYTYIDRGDTLTCLVKPQVLWVANKQFGVSWVCTSVRVQKQAKVSGYVFKPTDDEPVEESEEEEEVEEVEEVEYVQGSDEEQ
jgi:hypothetical protein